MKITIYELLGMIKDGKEPGKIKYNGLIYEKSKYNSTPRGYYYRINGGIKLWLLDEINSLSDTVEILEEEKKIPEKLNIELNNNDENKVNWYRATNLECELALKINKIIDYLKSKGE